MTLRVYISGAFVGSRDWEAALRRYAQLGSMLKDVGFEVYLPHTHTDPLLNAELSARAVFVRDKEEIHKADVLVALLDEPSHGVGAEIAMALCRGMTVLGACSRHRKASRFIQGMLETSANGVYLEYGDLDDVVERVVETTAALPSKSI